MRRGMTVVVSLATACGPAVEIERDSESDGEGMGSTSSGGATATGLHESSATTTSDPDDGTTTTLEPGSTTADESSSTGEPVDPCPPAIPGVTYLWCGNVSDDGEPATDGAWVYFVTYDEALWRVPAAGGEAETLAEGLGDVVDLAVADERVYWSAFFDGVVGSVAVAGGPVEILADDLERPISVAVGGGHAFVTQYQANLPVMRYELATGLATPLYPDQDYAGHAFVLEDALYFATSTNDGNDPTPLWRGTFDGAPLVEVLDADGLFGGVDLEGQTLWWARYYPGDSAILRTELGEPAVTTTIHTFSPQPLSLAATPERVYWTDAEIAEDQVSRLASVTHEGSDLVVHHSTSSILGGVVATDAGVVFLVPGALARLD